MISIGSFYPGPSILGRCSGETYSAAFAARRCDRLIAPALPTRECKNPVDERFGQAGIDVRIEHFVDFVQS